MFVWMFSLSFLWGLPSIISCSHTPCNGRPIEKTWAIPYFSEIWHIISWWSWWESHPCLKSYWTTSLSPYGEMRFGYIYNDGFGNWSRKCNLRPLPYWKSLWKKNHAVILVLRHQELWVCELLTNRHHRSCLCNPCVFRPDCNNLHITFLPQSHWRGSYPRSPFNETFFYLWTTLPVSWECLGSLFLISLWQVLPCRKRLHMTKLHNK